MNRYIPMRGPFPGRQYIPSNSDEGHGFIGHFCGNCARDRAAREGVEIDECYDDEVCQILGASFRGEAQEWRRLENGSVTCVAYVPAGQPTPPERCPHTPDLFEQGASASSA